jgi:membrane-associated phospholipid phosphatase
MTAKRDTEIVVRVIKGKTRNSFSAEETAIPVSGGQLFSRRLFAGYHAFVAGVCLFSLLAHPLLFGALALLHAAAAVALLRWAARPAPARGSRFGALWPWGLWFLSWIEIGRFTAWTGNVTHDASIIALDLAVFGVHLHESLAGWIPAPVTGEVMQAAYLSYYFLLLGPLLVFARRSRWFACERYTFAVMTTYLCCFIVYLLYPVLGPRALAAAQATSSEGDLAGLAEVLRQLGDSPGTAFPSSHCAGALTAALAAGRYLERPWTPVLVGWALLITVSTVATGNHYAIDSVCGLIVAFGVYLVFIRRFPPCAF